MRFNCSYEMSLWFSAEQSTVPYNDRVTLRTESEAVTDPIGQLCYTSTNSSYPTQLEYHVLLRTGQC